MRELQRKLWVCAKRSKTRRFHALYDRIYRSDVLWEAGSGCAATEARPGVDGETLRSIEQQGVDQFLASIEADLRAGRYRPSPVRRQYIPKADGKQRPLGIPTVRDRVVQMAAKIVIEPIFEADFEPCSYGFRPKRSATEALEAIRVAGNRGHDFVVDADIQGYFDSIDQEKLMELVEERISDRRVLKLIRQWLGAGVMEDGTVRETLAGTPQGGVISPLLANIYLHLLDRLWAKKCGSLGVLIRYADDFVVMAPTESKAKEALRQIQFVMSKLGSGAASGEDADGGPAAREGEFRVSWGVRSARSEVSCGIHAAYYMHRWPSPKATKRLRDRVHEITDKRAERGRCEADHRETEPRASRLGELLPDGNMLDREFHEDGQLRVLRSGPLAVSAGRAAKIAAEFVGPTSSFGVWVCIDCAEPCATRRKPHQ